MHDAAIEAYEKSLAAARVSAHSAITDANATLIAETLAKNAELSTKLNAMLNLSEANIAKAMEDAMGNVHKVAEDVASSATERLLGRAVDAGVVTTAVDIATKAQN